MYIQSCGYSHYRGQRAGLLSGRFCQTNSPVPLGESAILSMVGKSRIPLTSRSEETSFTICSSMYAPIEWPVDRNKGKKL